MDVQRQTLQILTEMANTLGGLRLTISNTAANPLFVTEAPLVNVLTKTYPVGITSQGLLTSSVLPSSGLGLAIPLTASEMTTIASAKKAVYQFIAVSEEKFYLDTDGLPVTNTDGQASTLFSNEIVGSQISNFRFMASVSGGNLVVLYFA